MSLTERLRRIEARLDALEAQGGQLRDAFIEVAEAAAEDEADDQPVTTLDGEHAGAARDTAQSLD